MNFHSCRIVHKKQNKYNMEGIELVIKGARSTESCGITNKGQCALHRRLTNVVRIHIRKIGSRGYCVQGSEIYLGVH